MKQSVESKNVPKAALYKLLENVDSRALTSFLVEIFMKDGYEIAKMEFPDIYDMLCETFHTMTMVCIKSIKGEKGNMGRYKALFNNEELGYEMPLHFSFKESLIIYIMLLMARAQSKDVDVWSLLQKNGMVFTQLFMDIYGMDEDEANSRFKMLHAGVSKASRHSTKLNLCCSDINHRVYDALGNVDNPFPFGINYNNGHLLLSKNNIILPDELMDYALS
jgi:hypothetical protein